MTTENSAEALPARLIRKEDFVGCESAFVDVRILGSEGKVNYSFIGSGVSQSADQFVNLREAHGFQIGGVQLPHNHVNNLHLHFTAEVFICAKGEWTCFWGADGKQGELILTEGDIVSVPTWIFRGFKNTGAADGFMFTALGGDDTGGIIWGPDVLREAAKTGLYLNRDNMLLDTETGQSLPPADQLMQPISTADIAELKEYTPEQFAAERVVTREERQWSSRPFLCNTLPGYSIELAPVIGYGLSEDRNTLAKITYPHGFSMEWLRGGGGDKIAFYKIAVKQVLINLKGRWQLSLNTPDGVTEITLEEWSIYSIPAGIWRSLKAIGEDRNELLSVCGGDARPRPEWQTEIVEQALEQGWKLDASGYIAKASLLPN